MIKQAADATEAVERAKTISRDVLKANAGHGDRGGGGGNAGNGRIEALSAA